MGRARAWAERAASAFSNSQTSQPHARDAPSLPPPRHAPPRLAPRPHWQPCLSRHVGIRVQQSQMSVWEVGSTVVSPASVFAGYVARFERGLPCSARLQPRPRPRPRPCPKPSCHTAPSTHAVHRPRAAQGVHSQADQAIAGHGLLVVWHPGEARRSAGLGRAGSC